MQVQKCSREPELDMKRDMDLIREILLRIEEDPNADGTKWVRLTDVNGHSSEEVAYHLVLLTEAGFVKGNMAGSTPIISRLTWEGHEFVDDIKDSGVWESTKARVAGLSGVALSVIAEIAKAEIKKKLGLP